MIFSREGRPCIDRHAAQGRTGAYTVADMGIGENRFAHSCRRCAVIAVEGTGTFAQVPAEIQSSRVQSVDLFPGFGPHVGNINRFVDRVEYGAEGVAQPDGIDFRSCPWRVDIRVVGGHSVTRGRRLDAQRLAVESPQIARLASDVGVAGGEVESLVGAKDEAAAVVPGVPLHPFQDGQMGRKVGGSRGVVIGQPRQAVGRFPAPAD